MAWRDEGDDEDSDKGKDDKAAGPGRRFMVLFSGVALLGDIAHDVEAIVSFSNIQTHEARTEEDRERRDEQMKEDSSLDRRLPAPQQQLGCLERLSTKRDAS